MPIKKIQAVIYLLSFSSFTHIFANRLSAAKSGNIRFSHAELHNVMAKDNIVCAFPNVEICLRIFLTLMVANCLAEH